MANRDYERNRRWRDRGYARDWNYNYDRDYTDRDYTERDYYNDRNYFGRDYSGRGFHDRNDYGEGRFSPYTRGYDADYETGDYEYDYWGTPYGDWTRGPYSGVGPQNYRRSDERIQDDVNERLTWHGHINASEIDVSVDDGVVTLRGTVDSRRERRMSEEVAENVPGVWDVINEIKVRHSGRWSSGERWHTREGQMREGQVREGMQVIGRDSSQVGQVKKVRGNRFLVDRPMARDVYVPMHAANVEGDHIRLHVRAGEVDNQGWEMPEILETS